MISLENPILQIVWIFFTSFICAFSKELNDYAKNPREESFLLFISEILLSGVCGVLIGLLTTYYTDNIYLISFTSGISGILGIRSIKIAIRVLLYLKDINISDEALNNDFKDENHHYKHKNANTIKKNDDKKRRRK